MNKFKHPVQKKKRKSSSKQEILNKKTESQLVYSCLFISLQNVERRKCKSTRVHEL